MSHEQFLQRALRLAADHSANGNNGPFGAVIVKDDQIISTGWNQVVEKHDPTAHAEIMAIRQACEKLETFNLQGCALYASCEPCPMCLSAIYWARLDIIYYAATRHDAASAGFDDEYFYQQVCAAPQNRDIKCVHLPLSEARNIFDVWQSNPQKKEY